MSRTRNPRNPILATIFALALLTMPFACGVSAQAGEKDVDFGPYMAETQKRIKRNWFPPRSGKTDRVVAVWTIHRDGSVSNIKILNHGDSKAEDEAAVKAINEAAPFKPLPGGSPESVDIQFTFDYNVFKDGKRLADVENGEERASVDAGTDTTGGAWIKAVKDSTASSPSQSTGDAESAAAPGPTDGAVRVNHLANLEALLNIIANGGEILCILLTVPLFVAGIALIIGMPGRRIFGVMVLLASPACLIFGLALPGLINWIVASMRDAGMFN